MRISKQGEEITQRFFEALDKLKSDKKIKGLRTFTRKHDINHWNLLTLRKEPSKRVLKPEYIKYLVQEYKISANWILIGDGNMYDSQI